MGIENALKENSINKCSIGTHVGKIYTFCVLTTSCRPFVYAYLKKYALENMMSKFAKGA